MNPCIKRVKLHENGQDLLKLHENGQFLTRRRERYGALSASLVTLMNFSTRGLPL